MLSPPLNAFSSEAIRHTKPLNSGSPKSPSKSPRPPNDIIPIPQAKLLPSCETIDHKMAI
jgi:hypothetical protein